MIRPYYKYEIADLYNVSTETFINVWLPKSGKLLEDLTTDACYGSKQKQFTVKQVEMIFERLGLPDNIEIEDYEPVPIRVYQKKKLADLYGWSVRVLIRFLKPALTKEEEAQLFRNIYDGNVFLCRVLKIHLTIKDVKVIFDRLGRPYKKK